MDKWGKDHWSTFAYVESLAVNSGEKGIAIPDNVKMRTNEKTHPHLVGNMGYMTDAFNGSGYPTRLKDGQMKGHDDWDCLDDAVREGLLFDVGTGLNRAFKLTEFGFAISAQLRHHKAEGKVFHTFIPNLSTIKVIPELPCDFKLSEVKERE